MPNSAADNQAGPKRRPASGNYLPERDICLECGLPPVTGYPNRNGKCYYCRNYEGPWEPDSGLPPAYTVDERPR